MMYRFASRCEFISPICLIPTIERVQASAFFLRPKHIYAGPESITTSTSIHSPRETEDNGAWNCSPHHCVPVNSVQLRRVLWSLHCGILGSRSPKCLGLWEVLQGPVHGGVEELFSSWSIRYSYSLVFSNPRSKRPNNLVPWLLKSNHCGYFQQSQ
jgi:hypothetical protein